MMAPFRMDLRLLLMCSYLFFAHPTADAFSPTHDGACQQQNRQARSAALIRLQETTKVIIFHKPPNCVTSHRPDGYVNDQGEERRTVYEEIFTLAGFVANIDATDNEAVGQEDAVGDNVADDATRTGTKRQPSTLRREQKSGAPNTKQASPDAFVKLTGMWLPLNSIGRLDADTTGLLLLTNDGGLIHHVTNPNAPTHDGPQGAVNKTYEALIMGHHDDARSGKLAALWEGVDIGAKYGGMTRPVDDLRVLSHPSHKTTMVSITISEGKNRQVRRMFHAIGSGVMQLKRIHIGCGLTLRGLQEGQWRMLHDEEISHHLRWEPRQLQAFNEGSRRNGRRNGTSNTPRRKRRPPRNGGRDNGSRGEGKDDRRSRNGGANATRNGGRRGRSNGGGVSRGQKSN